MASSARHLFLLAVVAVLAVATPRVGAWGGGRLFFSKTTRPEATVNEPEKAAATTAGTIAVPADAEDPNSAATFSHPSTGGTGGRGYGLYGRPEENFPSDYFRRGVHRNTKKLTSTSTEEVVPVGGRGEERAEPLVEDNNGSGMGRTTNTHVPTTTSTTEETIPVTTGGGERADPFVEDNGSGMGRPQRYYDALTAGGTAPEEQRNYYGMSDTRLYLNGRYYYDVDAGRYGYGRESNPVRTRPEEFAGDRRGRYNGNPAAVYHQYGNGNGNELGNGFQEEAQNGRYIP